MKLFLVALSTIVSLSVAAPVDGTRPTPLPFVLSKPHPQRQLPPPPALADGQQGLINSTTVVSVDTSDPETYTGLIVYSGASSPTFQPSSTAPLATVDPSPFPSAAGASPSRAAAPADVSGAQVNVPQATGGAGKVAGGPRRAGGLIIGAAVALLVSGI